MGDTSWMPAAVAQPSPDAATPVAYGGDLDSETLLAAHRCGLLPMDAEECSEARRRAVYDEQVAGAHPPVLAGGERPWMLSWWLPPARPVVRDATDLRLSRRTRLLLRDSGGGVLDTAVDLDEMVEALSRNRRWTWMTRRFVDAVRGLNDAGQYRTYVLRGPDGGVIGGTMGVHDSGVQSVDSFFGGPRDGVLTVFVHAIHCVRAGLTVDLQTPSDNADRITLASLSTRNYHRHLRPGAAGATPGPPIPVHELAQWLESEVVPRGQSWPSPPGR